MDTKVDLRATLGREWPSCRLVAQGRPPYVTVVLLCICRPLAVSSLTAIVTASEIACNADTSVDGGADGGGMCSPEDEQWLDGFDAGLAAAEYEQVQVEADAALVSLADNVGVEVDYRTMATYQKLKLDGVKATESQYCDDLAEPYIGIELMPDARVENESAGHVEGWHFGALVGAHEGWYFGYIHGYGEGFTVGLRDALANCRVPHVSSGAHAPSRSDPCFVEGFEAAWRQEAQWGLVHTEDDSTTATHRTLIEAIATQVEQLVAVPIAAEAAEQVAQYSSADECIPLAVAETATTGTADDRKYWGWGFEEGYESAATSVFYALVTDPNAGFGVLPANDEAGQGSNGQGDGYGDGYAVGWWLACEGGVGVSPLSGR